jgi:tripartite ATP-independent transporter DctP family solute receptor
MPRFSYSCAAVVLLSMLLSLGCGKSNEVKPKILRLAHVYGPTELLHRAAERFAEQVEKESGGTIKVWLFPSGQLGKEREIFEGLRLRSIDMMISGSSILGWYAPEYAVIDAPFLFRDYDHIAQMWQGEVGQEIRDLMRKRTGAEMLALWYRGPRYLTSTAKIIREPNDLPGFKLRVPEFYIYLKSWQVFGANVTPIPITDLFMALKLGVVDGQENPLATIYGNNLHEVQRYIMNTEHLLGILYACVGAHFRVRFTGEEQRIVLDALLEATLWYNAEMFAAEEEYRTKLRDAGVEFIDVDRTAFQELATKKIPSLFEKRYDSDIYRRIVEIK